MQVFAGSTPVPRISDFYDNAFFRLSVVSLLTLELFDGKYS